jgi:acyl-CoA thioester hydrolase
MAEPLFLSSMVAHQWQCDHFGHLNVRHYVAAFDDALFIMWKRIGLTVPALGSPGVIPVTAEIKTSFASETVAGTIANVQGRVLRVGTKSVTFRLELREEGSGRLLASCEAVEVFFDMQARVSSLIPDELRASLLERAEPS